MPQKINKNSNLKNNKHLTKAEISKAQNILQILEIKITKNSSKARKS